MTLGNILFIVEGGRAEPTFLKVLWNKFHPGVNYQIYSYNTNLSVLAKEYFANGDFDEDLDLIKLLKEKGTDSKNSYVLNNVYQDIYLVFDLDPQSEIFDSNRISKLMNHFNDSAVNGKLYLSYPMLEAWKDIKKEHDPDFENRAADMKDILSFKHTVNSDRYCWDRLRSYSKMDRSVFQTVIMYHLRKANTIQTGRSENPELNHYLNLDLIKLHSAQMDYLENENKILTLCTALFLVIEYEPRKFFTEMKTANTISETTMPDQQQ